MSPDRDEASGAQPPRDKRALTGGQVLYMTLGAFAVVVIANLALAFSAIGSFPGLVVQNSYVASQHFDAERAKQRALGWKIAAHYEGDRLLVGVTDAEGKALEGLDVTAVVGRRSTDVEDISLTLAPTAEGYAATPEIGAGFWRVEITARDANGDVSRAHTEIWREAAK